MNMKTPEVLPNQALAKLLSERLETWGDPVARAQLGQDIARIFDPAAHAAARHLTVTTDQAGNAVSVSWQDDEHRILEVVWEGKKGTIEPPQPAPAAPAVRVTSAAVQSDHTKWPPIPLSHCRIEQQQAPAAPTKCLTCNGHGLIGGHMQDGSGYAEPCHDCNAPAAPVSDEQRETAQRTIQHLLNSPLMSNHRKGLEAARAILFLRPAPAQPMSAASVVIQCPPCADLDPDAGCRFCSLIPAVDVAEWKLAVSVAEPVPNTGVVPVKARTLLAVNAALANAIAAQAGGVKP